MFNAVTFLILLMLLLFAVLSICLALQLRQARWRINKLLEEKAKIIEESDYYAELSKNPLGKLFQQDATPLIISFDKNGKILKVNDALLQKFGYTKNQLIHKNITGTILPKQKKGDEDIVYRLFKNPNLFIDTETSIQTKNGEQLWISWTNRINHDKKGKPVSANAVGFDITKRKQMEADLQYLSSIDPQTGVMNRHALLETGTTELKRAKRYGRHLSVVALKFQQKDMNHSLSDSELQKVITLTRRVIRSVDYLGRIGDTEFGLILPETERKNVPFLIQRLNQILDQSNKKDKEDLTLVYAATSYTKKSDTIDSLLSNALKKINNSHLKGRR